MKLKDKYIKTMNGINIKQITFAAITSLLLVACANEDMTDDSLPEGKYPLVINAVNITGDVQSRVSENPTDGKSSVWNWDGSEQIGVQLYEDGETASYTLKSDKTLSATDNQLYWNSTATTIVYTAWYPFADETIDLSKQNTDGLAYVMKGTGKGSYQSGVSLNFTHQLAKVRVKITAGTTIDMSDATISVLNYANCKSTKGNVTANGTPTYIPMKKSTYTDGNTYYEANVVAGTTLASDAFQIVTYGTTVKCTISPVELKEGQLHVITLTMVNKQINLSNGNDVNITGNGTYMITGSGTKPININGSPTIYLDNAKVAVTDDYTPAVNITGGSPTIYVKGTGSSLSSSKYGGIIMSNNANVKITGEGRDACKLTVTAGTGVLQGKDLDQYSFVGIGAATNKTCGSITIDHVQLEVKGGKFSNGRGGSAAIGTSGPDCGTTKCGDIYINAAQITAMSGAGAAAIGTSNTIGAFSLTDAHLVCGDIKIENSVLSITVMPYGNENYFYGAGIGTGCLFKVADNYAYTQIGNIMIDCEASETALAEFTNDFKLGGSAGNPNYKIGWGYHHCNNNSEGCSDHTINGFYNLNKTFNGWKNTWECR